MGNVGKFCVGICDDGGAETEVLYPACGKYEGCDCCEKPVDTKEPVEVDAVETVGAGETGGPDVKPIGAGVRVGEEVYPGTVRLAFVGGSAKPDGSDP